MHSAAQRSTAPTALTAVWCLCVRTCRRNTPLQEAAAKGHAAVAADLLTHGADVNAKDDDSCVLPVARSAGAASAV